MAAGKQGLYVVVWEWENKQRRWRPYPPEVTQQLERAFSKNLRSVFLGDSEPTLIHYTINLPQMEQECTTSGERVKVRRMFYPQSSPAGQGAVWQWAGDLQGDWHTYDMCVQCVIEESWGTGAQMLDMSNTFPMCPYVINFCNLNQMNKKTGFIRGIRRVPQAAYPVGRPNFPVPHQQQAPHHLHHHQHHHTPHHHMQAGSSKPSAGGSGAGSGGGAMMGAAGTSGEKVKRRGSRDEVDSNTTSDSTNTKSRSLIDKMSCFINGSRNSSMSPPASSSSSTTDSSGSRGASGGGGGPSGASNGPPKPLPRSNVPPVPKPRKSVPPTRPYPPQPQPQPPPPPPPQNNTPHQFDYQDNNLRREACYGRFGSNMTLDSDCSSSVMGGSNSRRPSVDTISTYLSQEGEDDAQASSSGSSRTLSLHHSSQGTSGNPRLDRLIRLDSDESMDDDDDDDVFGEDQEVCEVMSGAAHRSPAPRAPSPLPHHHHHHNSHTPHSQPNHFVPISAAQSGTDLGLQMNGVKRKRTGERAGAGHNSGGGGGGGGGSGGGSGGGGGDTGSHHHQHHHYNHHHHHNNNNNNNHRHHKHHQGSRSPIAPEDQLLVQYTSVVVSPPDEMCSICMYSLREPSGYSDEDPAPNSRGSQITGVSVGGVVRLVVCGHEFHQACVRQMARSTPQFLQCPNCKTLHGEKLGNQPNGHMDVVTLRRSLPGHPDCQTFKITYNISNGIQGPLHPHPGRAYHAVGFPRVAYVPCNEKGKKVVHLLREAWRRRLIFTIGPSVTMGMDDCVTWNEIHHKTEYNNMSGHGFPDPNYLDNVLKELELHGVSESTLV